MKILFLNCNSYLEATIPEGIALLSSILKRSGHEVDLFDTVFLKPKKDKLVKKVNSGGIIPRAIAFYKKTPHALEDLVANDQEADINEEFIKKIKQFNPDLIAASVMSRNYAASLELIKKAKPKCPVVFGGVHAILSPESIIKQKEIDYVCSGEGDNTLLELCNCLESGKDPSRIKNLYSKSNNNGMKIHKNPLGPFVDLNSLPEPDLSIFDSRHLFKPFLGNIYKGIFISTSRGCPRGCFYCVNNKLREIYKPCGKSYFRYQSPKIVAEHVKSLKKKYSINWIKFSDDTFLLRPLKDILELRDLLKPLKIKFGCSIDPATVNEEKIAAIKEMGCVHVSIGIETGNEKIRKNVLGRHISNEQIKKAVSIIKNKEIKISSFNIIGLPGETKENVYQTIRFNKELGIPDANLYVLYPFPGSKIFEDAQVSLDKHEYTPLNDAYSYNLSKISKDELSYFLRAFNLYLVLPESYWPKINLAEKNLSLFNELVELAQKRVNNKHFDKISNELILNN